MINIVCLKWGDKYGPEYVNRLYAAVERNVTKRFKFWCFTEDSTGLHRSIKKAPLRYADRLNSWWNKVYLFSDQIPIDPGELIFYIDLDTLIVDNIDPLLEDWSHQMLVLRDFYHGIAKTSSSIGSGLMRWTHGTQTEIWNNFIRDPQKAVEKCKPHGDQRWIEMNIGPHIFWQDLYRDAVVSFKVHCREGLPPGAKIICYHGLPSIPDSATKHTRDWRWDLPPQPWVLDYWKD